VKLQCKRIVHHDKKAKREMKIDIDKLTEEELIDLNHRIVERLRFLSQMRAHSKMLDFRSAIGSRLSRKFGRLCLG
jgi:hypothetical protein